jgi:hypothetical protein
VKRSIITLVVWTLAVGCALTGCVQFPTEKQSSADFRSRLSFSVVLGVSAMVLFAFLARVPGFSLASLMSSATDFTGPAPGEVAAYAS